MDLTDLLLGQLGAMTTRDYLDLAITLSIAGLAIDKWVHGRERNEDRQGHDIRNLQGELRRVDRRITLEISRVWQEFERIHNKASDMAAEYTKKGGELSVQMATVVADLRNLVAQMEELWRANDRRHSSRGSDSIT